MLKKLPSFGKPQIRTLENGIIDTGDLGFAGIAAVHYGGTCYVADGYRYEDEFMLALARHQESNVVAWMRSLLICGCLITSLEAFDAT